MQRVLSKKLKKMAKIIINKDKCKACFLCIEFCPKKILTVDKDLNKLGYNSVNMDSKGECSGCCICAIMCPDCCIEVYKD